MTIHDGGLSEGTEQHQQEEEQEETAKSNSAGKKKKGFGFFSTILARLGIYQSVKEYSSHAKYR